MSWLFSLYGLNYSYFYSQMATPAEVLVRTETKAPTQGAGLLHTREIQLSLIWQQLNAEDRPALHRDRHAWQTVYRLWWNAPDIHYITLFPQSTRFDCLHCILLSM